MSSRLRRTAVILFLVFCGLLGVIGGWQHLRALGSLVAGNCHQCTFGEAMEAAGSALSETRGHTEEAGKLKVISSDEKFTHTQSSLGDFWAPTNTDVAFLVAEQQAGIYGPIPKGAVVADCGANIGTYTRLALRAGASKVIAIEPVEDNVECLRRNFAAEIEAGRVVLVPKGVWDRDEVLEMKEFDNSALDSFVLNERPEAKDAPRVIRLPVTTLDRIVTEFGIERIDLIKMDIEGAELKALAGAAASIRRFLPRLVIATENQASDVREIPAYIATTFPGYRLEFGKSSIQADSGLRPTVAFFHPLAETPPDAR